MRQHILVAPTRTMGRFQSRLDLAEVVNELHGLENPTETFFPAPSSANTCCAPRNGRHSDAQHYIYTNSSQVVLN